MKLIADSGSTKTDWRLITNEKVISFETIGFNPYHISEAKIKDELLSVGILNFAYAIESIFFYGAGCSNESNCMLLKRIFAIHFKQAEIIIEHDLLGAARAACMDKPGLVGILGTGSNSCLYDGKNIIANSPALGYVLGDEGAGAYLGKKLIQAYFYGQLPEQIKIDFEKNTEHQQDTILDSIYKKELPNKYLASFTHFIVKHIENDFIERMILDSFRDFFGTHLTSYTNYKEYPLNLVGSIATIFEKQLLYVASEYDVLIGELIKHPIEKLVLFHTRE